MAEYKKVPETLKSQISAEAQAKYKEIIAKYVPDRPTTPSDDQCEDEIKNFVRAEVPEGDFSFLTNQALPEYISAMNGSVTKLLSAFLPGMGDAGNLTEMLEKGVYTSAALSQVLLLYDMIVKANIVVSVGITLDISSILGSSVLRPSDLAGFLTEANFAGAKAKLDAAAAKDNTTSSYAEIQFENGDFGFEDGDQKGFVNAVVATLRPVSNMLINGVSVINQILLLHNTSTNMGEHVYGAYEYLIPLLEGLGLEGVISSEAFTKRYFDAGKISFNAQLDASLLPIVEPIFGLITRIGEKPIETILSLLPKLSRLVTTGTLNDSVANAIHSSDLLSGVALDLSEEGLITMLKPLLDGVLVDGNIVIGGISIPMPKISLSEIAGLGELKRGDSVSASNKYRTNLEVNVPDTFTYLYNTIGDVVMPLLEELGIDFAVHGTFVKTEAPKYPHNGKMDQKVMKTMVAGLDGLLSGLFNMNDLINSGVCTQTMAAQAIEGIYGLLDSVDLSILGLSFAPNAVAAMLSEKEYANLRADLEEDSWENVSLYLVNGDEVIHQTDMGFKDGDRDGFLACVVASLRPITKLLGETGILTNTVDENGNTAYGLYETLMIPLFEALGITPAASSATYTDNYNQLMKKTDKGTAYNYLVTTILSPVLGLINQLAAAPVDTLMNLLPNLAYAVQYNLTLAFVGNLLPKDAAGNIDLAGMVNGLIGGLLPGAELPAINLDAFASGGSCCAFSPFQKKVVGETHFQLPHKRSNGAGSTPLISMLPRRISSYFSKTGGHI